jgi:hypothetical protein
MLTINSNFINCNIKKFTLFAILSLAQTTKSQNALSNSLDPIPSGWTSKVFALSKNYPINMPVNQVKPWKVYNFKTQPLQYINALKSYVLQGNIQKDWILQNNTVRKWYHTPSMIWGPNGREFINGLTRERSSRPKELHPNQNNFWQNWAVGFYNPLGGYTIGKVYQNINSPNASKAIFPEGTVAAKLLFTNAPLSEVPYLQNSFIWQANIHTAQSGTTNRSPASLRLLQMDIAVKDSRASNSTDWVMVTFAYNNNAGGTTPWDKLVPVGLQWGNDPTKLSVGQSLAETWINPAYKSLFTFGAWSIHTGYNGRMNGPVDNPNSSCLSCHGTSQIPSVSTGMVPTISNPASINTYFRNINPPLVFEDKPNVNEISLDYSLQLSVGIPLAISHAVNISPMMATKKSEEMTDTLEENDARIIKVLLTTRDFEYEENDQIAVVNDSDKAIAHLIKSNEQLSLATPKHKSYLLVFILITIIGCITAYLLYRKLKK